MIDNLFAAEGLEADAALLERALGVLGITKRLICCASMSGAVIFRG